MPIKGSPVRYGTVAIALHWISAVAVVAMIGTGFAASIASGPAQVAILQAHVPLGITVLVLTFARLAWRFVDIRPQPPAGQARWQAFVAMGVHGLLYAVILVMGASGIGLMALSGAAGPLFFGASAPLADFSTFAPMAVHALAALLLIALVGIHLAGAFYHQFIRRDGALARMAMGLRQTGSRRDVKSSIDKPLR